MRGPSLYSNGDKTRELPCVNTEHYRSEFRRDYARLIHSPAFRRLQGKTQLFRGLESDFFRNRLTHSLEVAQIAKSIAIRINNTDDYFSRFNLDSDLIETAALAHDLGHPPFGHTGEEALDKCMKDYGGFEGNAQTLRILARLEKKEVSDVSTLPVGVSAAGEDHRLGLNLTHRTLAALLKYDRMIPEHRSPEQKVSKGYYFTEAGLIHKIKKSVCRKHLIPEGFKTIECSIMDLADDIAYSVYDLEDCFKAGFMTPLDLLASNEKTLTEVAERCARRIATHRPGARPKPFTDIDVVRVLTSLFEQQFKMKVPKLPSGSSQLMQEMWSATNLVKHSSRCADNGYLRTELTAKLVGEFVGGVKVSVNQNCPPLSFAYLQPRTLEKVEVLKNFTYTKMIQSPRLKVVERRGKEIVTTIFEALMEEDGSNLMPADFGELYRNFSDRGQKQRVVCDFIAGMTDRYAVEFYHRLTSESAQSIWKPF